MVRILKDSFNNTLPTDRKRTKNSTNLRPLFLASTAVVDTNAKQASITTKLLFYLVFNLLCIS